MKNQFSVIGNTAYITAYNKGKEYTVMIDPEDLLAVYMHYKGKTLQLHGGGREAERMYIGGGEGTSQRYLHRFIMGLHDADPRHVDHINGNQLDNRRSNLRVLSARQNMLNRKVKTNTGLRYVRKVKDGYEFQFLAKPERISVRVKRETLEEILAVRHGFIQQHKHLLPDHVIAVPEFR